MTNCFVILFNRCMTIREFREKLKPYKAILAFDYGEKRLGLAVSDLLLMTANPLEIVYRSDLKKDVDAIKNISADAVVKAYDLNPLDAVRLDDDGEKAVKILKKFILKELENI